MPGKVIQKNAIAPRIAIEAREHQFLQSRFDRIHSVPFLIRKKRTKVTDEMERGGTSILETGFHQRMITNP